MRKMFVAALVAVAVLLAPLLAPTPAHSQPPANTSILCNLYAPTATLSAGTTQVVAGVTGKSIYVCGFDIVGVTTGTVQLEYGTGTLCTTPTSVTPAFNASSGTNLVDHIVSAWAESVAGQSLCAVVVTGTAAVQVYYTQF